MKYAFQESCTLLYPGYRDAETGGTLVAEPGGVYDVLPGMPPDGRWAPADEEPAAVTPRIGAWLGVKRELSPGTPMEETGPGSAGDEEGA